MVGDGVADYEHTMVRPCTEVHLAHGGPHKGLDVLAEGAQLADFASPHIRIARQPSPREHHTALRPLKTTALDFPRRLHPRSHRLARFAQPVAGQLVPVRSTRPPAAPPRPTRDVGLCHSDDHRCIAILPYPPGRRKRVL